MAAPAKWLALYFVTLALTASAQDGRSEFLWAFRPAANPTSSRGCWPMA
jgi:hypothetical protein